MSPLATFPALSSASFTTARFLTWPVLLASLLTLACCSPPTDPEQIATAFVEEAAAAFEDRDLRTLRSLISPNYLDSQKRNGEQIASIASRFIMGSRSIYLYTDLETAMPAEGRIRATALAAFAARPVAHRSLLPQVNADVYWFDIVLAEENGAWRLIASSWRTAMLDDIFGN